MQGQMTALNDYTCRVLWGETGKGMGFRGDSIRRAVQSLIGMERKWVGSPWGGGWWILARGADGAPCSYRPLTPGN